MLDDLLDKTEKYNKPDEFQAAKCLEENIGPLFVHKTNGSGKNLWSFSRGQFESQCESQ